ncbi:MAG: MFS transporter [Clostridia bacterium]|nr:MFS transporter [Clostridia bacterium]
MRVPRFLTGVGAEMNHLFFEKGNPEAKGRRCMMLESIMANISAWITGGTFYTGFLLGNDIAITDIGIITALPYLASLLTLFTPAILGRFKKRRWILAITRVLYFFINIVGLTVMPMFVHDKTAKLIWFGIIVFVGNAINFLFVSGYTDWHLNFLSDNVRASFFSVQQFTNTLMGCGAAVMAGIAADALAGTPHQMTVIIWLRYIGFIFALLDVFFLCLPKEYPYPSTQKVRLTNIITLPLKNKKFIATILLYCLHVIIVNLPGGVLNAYLLSTVGATYLQINLINVCYAIVVLLFSGFWQKLIRRLGWLNVFSITYLLIAPTYVMYMFLNSSNVLWLYTLLRMLQHIIGAGQNVISSNLTFLNMPTEDRSNFTAFSSLVANLTVWLSITLGTWFVDLVGGFVLQIGAFSFDGMQLLFGIVTLLSLASYLLAKIAAPRLEPKFE